MKSMPKWFLVPPAVALLLIFSPFSQPGASPARKEPPASPNTNANPNAIPSAGQPTNSPTADQPAGERSSRPSTSPALPRTPDLWQMGSGLLGVLALGVGGLFVLRKLRGTATPTKGAPLMTLRQSLRLGAKQTLHAIEFDERILLVGDSDKGLVLIESGRLPERAADEAEVLARSARGSHVDAVAGDDTDDGAVPKNLVIPRPEQATPRRLPKPPQDPAAAAKAPTLTNFRELLQKAAR